MQTRRRIGIFQFDTVTRYKYSIIYCYHVYIKRIIFCSQQIHAHTSEIS